MEKEERKATSNSILVQFWTTTWKHFTGWDIWMGLLLIIATAITVTAHFADNDLYRYRGIGFVGMLVAYLLVVFRPMVKMGQQRHKQLDVLTAWAIIGFLVILACLILAFFTLADLLPKGTEPAKLYDRLGFVPPVIAAIWAAAFGWFISYQSAMKTQRTAHAVALTMQLLTNAEVLGRFERFRRVFPPPAKVNLSEEYFEAEKITELPALRLKFDIEAAMECKLEILREIHLIEAIDALRSILNQYEFMAVGIKQGDLDEDILYETVSTNVRSIWARTECFRQWVNSKREALAWEHLDELATSWGRRLADEEHALAQQTFKTSLVPRGTATGPQALSR